MQFRNDSTDLTVIVSSWVISKTCRDMQEYIDVYVAPQTEVTVVSSNEIWFIGSLLKPEYCEQWKAAKLPFEPVLAKFIKPRVTGGECRGECGSSECVWNYYENQFDLKYEDGVVVWSEKK